MDPFEYITVLISIVLGLGITQILTGIADLIHRSDRVLVYWPHLVWIVFVLLLHVQEWWLLYELKTYEKWRLPIFLFVTAYPVNLFVLARILFPFALKGKQIDLKVFYYEHFRKIFLIFSLSAILSILHNLLISGMGIETQILQIMLAWIFIYMAARKVINEWLHKSLVASVFIILVVSMVVQWDVWLID